MAKRHGLRAQEVLKMYLFEHLLLRLEASAYAVYTHMNMQQKKDAANALDAMLAEVA